MDNYYWFDGYALDTWWENMFNPDHVEEEIPEPDEGEEE